MVTSTKENPILSVPTGETVFYPEEDGQPIRAELARLQARSN